MVPVAVAEALILDCVSPLRAEQDTEWVSLLNAHGRVLAVEVTSALDFPHWDNSAMDGYAVRFADVKESSVEQPVILNIIEEIPAGYSPQWVVESGQAARIMTGAVMPDGADTIVIQENAERQGDRLSITSPPQFQEFVRHRASFYRAGEPLLPAGICLAAPEIAVLAAAQCSNLSVYRRPRVAILSTGNELVAPDQPLQAGQIVDSNQYALAALVTASGADPLCLGIVPDAPSALREAIAHAVQQADVVLSSGGVSVGDYDYIDRILADLKAKIHIRAVAIKPGKPLTFATFEPSLERPQPTHYAAANTPIPKLYFGLPGNPVSSLVSFWRFVQPALRKLSGQSAGWTPQFLTGRSRHDLRAGGQRETYLWGRLQIIEGDYAFSLAGGGHSSGNLINLAQTNALAVVPVGQTQIIAGESVHILPIGPLIASDVAVSPKER